MPRWSMPDLDRDTVDTLVGLEDGLWRTATRFDPDHMDHVLADDFLEFGRSGRVYDRRAVIDVPAVELDVWLHGLRVHAVTADVALLTYVSEARFDTLERANRSSLWVREGGRWRLRFHQGTPLSST